MDTGSAVHPDPELNFSLKLGRSFHSVFAVFEMSGVVVPHRAFNMCKQWLPILMGSRGAHREHGAGFNFYSISSIVCCYFHYRVNAGHAAYNPLDDLHNQWDQGFVKYKSTSIHVSCCMDTCSSVISQSCSGSMSANATDVAEGRTLLPHQSTVPWFNGHT